MSANELIPYLAGVALSLMMAYVPGASDWYGALDGTRKRLVMLGLLLVAASGYVALGCAPFGADFGVPAEVCAAGGVAALADARRRMETARMNYAFHVDKMPGGF